MNDQLKIKVIKAILRDWYECGCDRAEPLEGIILAIDAIVDIEDRTEDACDTDSCKL